MKRLMPFVVILLLLTGCQVPTPDEEAFDELPTEQEERGEQEQEDEENEHEEEDEEE